MKEIRCDACGSNDLVLKGEFFVCEACGTKYMKEEPQRVEVVVDRTESLDTRLNRLRRLWGDGNTEQAFKEANAILDMDAANVEALYIRGLCSLIKGKIQFGVQSLKKSMECSLAQKKRTKAHFDFVLELLELSDKYSKKYLRQNPDFVGHMLSLFVHVEKTSFPKEGELDEGERIAWFRSFFTKMNHAMSCYSMTDRIRNAFREAMMVDGIPSVMKEKRDHVIAENKRRQEDYESRVQAREQKLESPRKVWRKYFFAMLISWLVCPVISSDVMDSSEFFGMVFLLVPVVLTVLFFMQNKKTSRLEDEEEIAPPEYYDETWWCV